MNDQATMARESAQHCEAIKYAFRQSKDGMVVSFVLHPSSVPPALQLAAIGARFMLAFVEIGGDETPINRKEEQPSSLAPESKPAPPPSHPARAPLTWEDITPAQQAGIRCNEVAFVKFLQSENTFEVTSTAQAAAYVRDYCGVKSRSDIRDGQPLARWQHLESKYRSWLYAPQVGAA